MPDLRLTFAATLGVAALCPIAPGVAQDDTGFRRFELTPYFGAYVPVTDAFSINAFGLIPGTLVPVEVDLDGKQNSGFAIGGRLDGWLGRSLAVEGTFGWASSDVETTRVLEAADTTLIDEATVGAAVWTASLRLVGKVVAVDRAAVILIGGGPALIGRSGDAYGAPAFDVPNASSVRGTTDVGGVLGLEVRVDASARVAIRLDAEAYLYSLSIAFDDVVFGTVSSPSKFQTDLLFSAGFAIGL